MAAKEDRTSLPLIESPNRSLRASPEPKKQQAPSKHKSGRDKERRKGKRSSPAQQPRLAALISLGKSRTDMELFLTMRGIRKRCHKQVIDEAIAAYNAQHPKRPYQPIRNTQRARRPSTKGKQPETSVGGSIKDHSAPAQDYQKPQKKVGMSAEERRVMMGLPASGPTVKKMSEYTDMKLDRKLQQLEAHRQRVIDEIERRVLATEVIQRAARMQAARNIRNQKREERARKEAALQMQRVFRGHTGRQRALAVNERKQQALRQTKRVHDEAERIRQLRASGSIENQADAAVRIQAVARGKKGRREASKIVRPFEFSLGGQHFSHKGRRTNTPKGLYRGVPIPGNTGVRPDEKSTMAPQPVEKKSNVGVSGQSPEDRRRLGYILDPDNIEMDIFRMIDKDMDGYITVQDLVAYLAATGAVGHDMLANTADLIAEADLDGDGKLDAEEFMTYIVNSRKEHKEVKAVKKEELGAKARRTNLINKLKAKRDQDRQRYGRF